jgi:hypothetical protein
MKGQPLNLHPPHSENDTDLLDDEEGDEEDKEELLNNDDEEEEEPPAFINQYTVEFVTQYKDELILHWGIGKKVPCQWERPDDKYLPALTTRWSDDKACQTRFGVQDDQYKTAHFNFSWT